MVRSLSNRDWPYRPKTPIIKQAKVEAKTVATKIVTKSIPDFKNIKGTKVTMNAKVKKVHTQKIIFVLYVILFFSNKKKL